LKICDALIGGAMGVWIAGYVQDSYSAQSAVRGIAFWLLIAGGAPGMALSTDIHDSSQVPANAWRC